MKRLHTALLCVVVLALVPGCAALSRFLQTAFQQPTFGFKNVAFQDIALSGLTLDTIWELRNPNSMGLSLAEVDYALFVEDQQLVAGSPPNGLQIPARGATELHFPTNVKFQDLAGVLQTFLTKDSARYRAEGRIGVQTPIGILKFPLRHDGDFEVPKLPQVVFGNPRITQLTFQGATLEIPLNVTNRNTYGLPVNGLSGALTLAGAPVGQLSTGDLGNMEGKATRQVSLPITVNFLTAGTAVANALRGGNAQVAFNANVQSGGVQVPLRVDQLVSFIK